MMSGNSTLSMLGLVVIIIGIAVAGYYLYQAYKAGKLPIKPTQVGISYDSVEPPMIIVGSSGAPEEIPISENEILYMFNNSYMVATGDVLKIVYKNDEVIGEKTLSFDQFSGIGDWSLLQNLLSQMKDDNQMDGNFSIALYRNGNIMIQKQVTSNIKQVKFFDTDYRISLPASVKKPFILDDVIWIADPNTMIAEYIYYCIIDIDNGIFQRHDASPKVDMPSRLSFQQLLNTFPGKFLGIANAYGEEIYSMTTFKNQNEAINTGIGYPIAIETFPGENDGTVLQMIPTDTQISNGDVIEIWSYSSASYFTIGPINLTINATNPENQELSDDAKYLISGVYALIKSRNLEGYTMDIKREGVVILSKTIPENVTGIKFFDDPRMSTPNLQNSLVLGDNLKVVATANGQDLEPKYYWCNNIAMKSFTNVEGSFNGTIDEIAQQIQLDTPGLEKITFTYSNQYSSQMYKNEVRTIAVQTFAKRRG